MSKLFEIEHEEKADVIERLLTTTHRAIDQAFPHAKISDDRQFTRTVFSGPAEDTAVVRPPLDPRADAVISDHGDDRRGAESADDAKSSVSAITGLGKRRFDRVGSDFLGRLIVIFFIVGILLLVFSLIFLA